MVMLAEAGDEKADLISVSSRDGRTQAVSAPRRDVHARSVLPRSREILVGQRRTPLTRCQHWEWSAVELEQECIRQQVYRGQIEKHVINVFVPC